MPSIVVSALSAFSLYHGLVVAETTSLVMSFFSDIYFNSCRPLTPCPFCIFFYIVARYPNHKDRKRIETQYAKELEKLKTYDADFYHGQHTGFLAASRLFHQHADILEINQHTEVTPQMMALVERHGETIERSRQSFPDLTIDPCGD